MTETLAARPPDPPDADSRPPRPQGAPAKDLRFLEDLQAALAGCRTETSIYSTAVHRVVPALAATACCLALYDPVTQTLDLAHQRGQRVSGRWRCCCAWWRRGGR